MASRRRTLRITSVLFTLTLAQVPGAQIPGLPRASTPDSATQPVADPLGRSTPRGTIRGLVRSVQREDFADAARYLQPTERLRENADSLAANLKTLLDRYFSGPVTDISENPEGEQNDGLVPDQERVGPLTIGGREADIILVRVTDPQAGPVWLVSSATLAQVPAWLATAQEPWVERVMPRALVKPHFLGISLAHLVALAAALLIPLVALRGILSTGMFLVRRFSPQQGSAVRPWYEALRWPAIATLAIAAQLSLMPALGIPIAFRVVYARLGLIVFVVALAWFIRRLLTLGAARARNLASGADMGSTRSLILLGERLIKTIVVVVAVFAILTIVGVDTKTALAGVGIGGVALALGAQKTVENFLGGVFLLTDRAIAVGDQCSISNRVGIVEDITLRSVRLRTTDQTLVSVPAGVLAQAGIENFSTRRKIMVQTKLRLRYGTSVEQLRQILTGIRGLLDGNPKLEAGTSRIRLVDFGEQAVELELFGYVLTADGAEFLAIREALLLDVAVIVEQAGSGFAQPTQFIYVDEQQPDAPRTIPVAKDGAPRTDVRVTKSTPEAPADLPTRTVSR